MAVVIMETLMNMSGLGNKSTWLGSGKDHGLGSDQHVRDKPN